jgi:sarcosine oxidase
LIGDHGGYTLPDLRGVGLKFGHGCHRHLARPEENGFDADLQSESAAILGACRA